MCFAQNISLIKIVKKFPKQWNESVIHMPTPIFNVLCVIAGICDLIVAYNLFVTMDLTGMLLVVAMCVVCVVIALIRLKSGAIDLQALETESRLLWTRLPTPDPPLLKKASVLHRRFFYFG